MTSQSAIQQPANRARRIPENSVLMAGIGDSITYQNTYGSSILLRAIGYMTWLMVLSKGRIFFDNALNFGVAGETTAQILARAPAASEVMRQRGVRLCAFHASTNDLSGGVTPAAMMANYSAICNILMAKGITPVLFPILPRQYGTVGVPITAANQRGLQRYATLQRNYARSTPGVIMADPTLNWTDQSNALAYPIGGAGATSTSYTIDGLHPACRGAFWIATQILSAIQYLLDTPPPAISSQADVYNATDNPSGNLLANGFMVGSTAATGTGTSGNVAPSYIIERSGGTTGAMVCSKATIVVDAANSYQSQLLVCSAPAGSATESFRMYQQVFSNIAIGDQIYGECDVVISGVGAASFRSLTLTCTDGVTSPVVMQPDSGFYMPDQSWSGTLRTPLLTTTAANVGSLTLLWQLDGTVASNGVTVQVSRFSLRKAI